MSIIELRAEPRSVVGKKVRFLRRQGMVPANIFGQSSSTPIQVAVKEVEQTIRRAGHNQLVSLGVAGGETTTVLITKWQRHPYKADLLHVDFFRVAMTETMQLAVPIRLIGEAPAVRITGGQPFQTLAAVTVECLPTDIPEAIEVDISRPDIARQPIYAALGVAEIWKYDGAVVVSLHRVAGDRGRDEARYVASEKSLAFPELPMSELNRLLRIGLAGAQTAARSSISTIPSKTRAGRADFLRRPAAPRRSAGTSRGSCGTSRAGS